MSKIKHLPPDLINKIAAGEVVERPASIVKELVENSIDAKSTEIKITIEKGGKDKIEIIDNGTAIAAEDLPLTILNHATSKINSFDDLNNLSSLGFRGEAIASISSVSDFKILSRQKGNDLGNEFNIKTKDINPIGMHYGTKVIVNNLFRNIPARREFLKTDPTEYKAILDVLYPIVLSNLNIKFTLVHNDKQVFNLNATESYKNRVEALFPDMLDNFIEVDHQDQYIKVKGVINKPSKSTKRSTFKYVVVNNRSIKSTLVYAAIKQGYGTLLMPVMQPNYILMVEIDKHLVDVNVHPRKEEVRFSNESLVFSSIRAAVQNALQNALLIPTPSLQDNNVNNVNNDQQVGKIKTANNSLLHTPDIDNNKKTENRDVKQNRLDKLFDDLPVKITEPTIASNTNKQITRLKNINNTRKLRFEDIFKDSPILKEDVSKYSNGTDKINTQNTQIKTSGQNIQYQETLGDNKETTKVLIINNLYILAEEKDGLVIYDQHALHERVNFEKLMNVYHSNAKKKETQSLLLPEQLDLNDLDKQTFLQYKSELESVGFVIDSDSEKLIVKSIPSMFTGENIKELIKEFVSNAQEFKDVFIDDKTKTALTYLSCRSSIKAGDKITEQEATELINRQADLKNEYTCPHGRPLKIKLTYNELGKLFKRIV